MKNYNHAIEHPGTLCSFAGNAYTFELYPAF